jgi:hypothetical protein
MEQQRYFEILRQMTETAQLGMAVVLAGLKNGRYTSWMETGLPFEEVHFVGFYGFAVAEEGDDDAETDCGFSGRVGDDEEREDLAGYVAVDAREEDEIDVDGVEDQFDGHEHDDDVASRNHADTADEEERETQK